MITSARRYWLQDLDKLPQPTNGRRPPLLRRPLFDMELLQEDISDGALSVEQVLIVTRKARNDLEFRLQWSIGELLDFVRCLRPYGNGSAHDFSKAEWCRDSHDNWYPCDVYATGYDEVAKCRSTQGIEVYLKFSLRESDGVEMLVVSVHPSN